MHTGNHVFSNKEITCVILEEDKISRQFTYSFFHLENQYIPVHAKFDRSSQLSRVSDK